MKNDFENIPIGKPTEWRVWALVRITDAGGKIPGLIWACADMIPGETGLCAKARSVNFLLEPKVIDSIALPADENPNNPNGAWDKNTKRKSPFK